MQRNRTGSAIAAVILCAVILAVIVTALVQLIYSTRRINLSRELQVQANNVAEAAADYTYSFVSHDIDAKSLEGSTYVPKTGFKPFNIGDVSPNASAFLVTNPTNPVNTTTTAGRITYSTPDIHILKPEDRTRYFVNTKDRRLLGDVNANQWVYETKIPVVARVTATQDRQEVTAHIRKDITLREIPLFQYAVYYSGQAIFHRSFNILGDIHTNGALILHSWDTGARYTGFVTTASRFYRGSTIDGNGTGSDAYGYTRVTYPEGYLDFGSGVFLDRGAVSAANVIDIFKGTINGTDTFGKLGRDFDSTMADWKDEATEEFDSHLRDEAFATPKIEPYGSEGYRQDAASTPFVNEFNNAPYSLIEPLILSGAGKKSSAANSLKLAARASLIIRIEAKDPRDIAPSVTNYTLHRTAPTNMEDKWKGDIVGDIIPRVDVAGTLAYTGAQLREAKDITEAFVIRAYRYLGGPPGGQDITPTLVPVQLPTKVFGRANPGITAVERNEPFIEGYTVRPDDIYPGLWRYLVESGLHDSRLGRPVDLLTVDIAELKRVMETPIEALTEAKDRLFRRQFNVDANGGDWNGIIYIEFPTSLDFSSTASSPPADGEGIVNSPPADADGIISFPFRYGTPETRHPDRHSEIDARQPRTDKIVPIDKELRRYYDGNERRRLPDRHFAIPAVQIINAKQLPNPPNSPGFTLATNVPVYLIGSYNSDGDYNTGTRVNDSSVTAWAQPDVGEVSSAIFCDTFTVLSDEWGDVLTMASGDNHRLHSFYGNTNDEESPNERRRVLATNRIEIGACIAMGEYPIFEFLGHALENFYDVYYGTDNAHTPSDPNPIVYKGSLAAMYHSEIQHFKEAYARDPTEDLQQYFQGHGQAAIPAVRFHQFLVDGIFPPGTPIARIPTQSGFRLLRRGDLTDNTFLNTAGF